MSRTSPTPEIDPETLIEALEACHGLLLTTVQYLKKNHGINLTKKKLLEKLSIWGMEDWVETIQKTSMENAMCRRISDAIKGDSNACTYILDRFGHHISFLPERESNDARDKGTILNVLEYVTKGD